MDINLVEWVETLWSGHKVVSLEPREELVTAWPIV